MKSRRRLSLHAAARALARCRASARQRGTVWTGSRVSLRQQRGIPNTRIHIAGTAEPSCMKCHRRCGIIAAGRLSLHAAARALARCRASARQRGRSGPAPVFLCGSSAGFLKERKKEIKKFQEQQEPPVPVPEQADLEHFVQFMGVGDLQYCVRQESDQGYVIPSIF